MRLSSVKGVGDVVLYENQKIIWMNAEMIDKETVVNELVDRYGKQVFLIAYSFVKDKGIAEDIAQEVFMKCYQRIETFKGESSIKTWITRITINTCKDVLRRSWFKVFKRTDEYVDLFASTVTVRPESELEKNHRQKELVHAVLQLPLKYREIIVLFYYHDYTIEEISESLKMNKNTIKTRLTRGRLLLKDFLEEEGEA